MQRIKLPEHYSSRLLFVDDKNISDPTNFKLYVRDTTSDVNCTEMNSTEYPNNFLLGKLTNNIWYIEDSGIYDSNHEHTAEIYTIDNNVETKLYDVTRIMEYGGECDRLYMEHGGGLKVILLDSPTKNMTLNFYIKYERSLPAAREFFGSLVSQTDNQQINNCVMFLKQNGEISEVIQMIFGLVVTKEDKDENDNYVPMENINYCNITPTDISCSFSQISVFYNIEANLSNEPKISLIGTKTISGNIKSNDYVGKFVSYRYAIDNDSYVEPGYFIVQAPKNRSWICYRTCYGHMYYGAVIVNFINMQYKFKKDKQNNNCKCTNIRWEGAGMNGYYGTLINNKYVYIINIDRSQVPFILYLPEIFWDYNSITYLGANDNIIQIYDGRPIENIYNELDGLFYKVIIIDQNSTIHKIKLEYNSTI